jgi:hypothetical protein
MTSLAFRRRQFLKGLGASGALLPLLDFDRPAHAQGKGPKRFVAWMSPNGVSDEYWPKGGAGPLLLTDILSPLEPHKSDILLVDNMTLKAMTDDACCRDFGGHPSPNWLLTANDAKPGKFGGENLAIGNSRTLDLVIADHLAKANPTRFLSLPMGIDNKEENNAAYKYLTFNGPAVGTSANAPKVEDNMVALYGKLFTNGMPGQNGSLVKLLAQRKSILDYTGRSLERFAQNLGTDSKQLIGLHITAIRDIEKQLTATPTDIKGPTIDPMLNSYDKKAYDKIGKVQLDILVAAFAAGQTSVASMAWSNGHNNSWVFYWLGAEFTQPISGGFNSTLGHHDIAHQGGAAIGTALNARRKQAVDKWFQSQLAYLIAELKKRNIFSDTMIYFSNNMGNGAAHNTNRIPMIVAGGGVAGGRFVKPAGSKPHNHLLISMMNAFGIEGSTFGSPRYQGALPEFKV